MALMLVVSMLGGLFILPASAKEKVTDSEYVAYAIMGENLKTKNFASFKVGAQADVKQITERSGEECWIIDKANGLQSDKICMVLDSEFKSGVNDGDAYIVEVDYFDVAKGGFFFLAYDGQRPRGTNEYYARAEEKIIYTTGTEKWKTATFRIDDAKFTKSLEGSCDLFIGTRSSLMNNNNNYLSQTPIPFKEVRITKVPGANPVRNVVSTDVFGNAYSWFSESKIIHNKFTNLRDEKLDVDVIFEFTNGDGYTAYSKTEKMSFEAGESKDFDFNFGEFKRCDRYNYFVTVKNEELGINSRVQYSVVAIIKADPDGIVNEHMNINGPGYKGTQSSVTLKNHGYGLDMLKTAGFNGIRYDDGWLNRELTLGTITADSHSENLINEAVKRDMEALPNLYMSNNLITGGWNRFAETEEQFARLEKAAPEIIKILADKTDTYEAWNEPDLKNFAQNFTPERYMRTYTPIAEALKKYDPNAKIGYLCYASAHGNNAHDYTTEMLEMGLDEMIRGNAITFHGYPNPNPEKFGTTDKIQWYVDELEKFGVSRDEYEIWLTEYGGTVADKHIASRRRQGAVTVRETLMQRIDHGVERFYVYRYDDPGVLTFDREASFGHVSNGTGFVTIYGKLCVPWESFVMLTGYNYLFAKSEPAGKIVNEPNLKMYKFTSEKFGKDIITMNTISDVEIVTLDLGVNEIQYFDEYANETKLYSEDGIFTFTATEYPHYIMGNFAKTDVLENSDKFAMNLSLEAVSNDEFVVKIENNTGEEVTVVPEMADGMSEFSEYKIGTGVNTVSFKNTAEVGKAYEIRFNMKKTDKVCSVMCMEMESTPIATAAMSIQLKSPKNFNKWQGVTMIENKSDIKVLTGKFEILSPENLKTSRPVNISFIPTGTTAEVFFDLPEISKKQIYTLEYKLSLDSGEVIEGETKVDTTCASYASKRPVIDGVMGEEEWNKQTLMQSSTVDNVVYSTNWEGSQWKGPEDQSVKAYAMWDEEKVYFCFDVTDDVFSQENEGNRTWNGDSVQFGVYMGSGDEYVAVGAANSLFTEIGIAKTPNGVQAYRFRAQDSDKHKVELIPEDKRELAVTVSGNKHIYELAMPWDTLLPDGITPKANSRLGFSFLVNDNDGEGRRGAVLFASGIFYSKDSSQFTYINLIGE